jgi:glutamate racemase
MKLGVFDSGIGGEAVAVSLRKAFPDAEINVVNDHDNVPYGSKTIEQIKSLTDMAIQPLLTGNCDIIIIACNSASAAAIEFLREKYPTQLFIGLEPMVKPATAMTKSGTIVVCATPATLASDRYRRLVEKYGQNTRIIEPDCSRWAYMIEHNQIDKSEIEKTINNCCEEGADVIVLACTHYHWINNLITEIVKGRAKILEPSDAIIRRILTLVGQSSTDALPTTTVIVNALSTSKNPAQL